MSKNNKLSHFWMFDEDGGTWGYGKQIAPAQIGEAWQFSKNKDGHVLLAGNNKPTRLELHVIRGPEPVDQWVAQDAAHVQLYAERRMNANLARRKGEFEIALQPLKRMLDALKYHDERAALINKITSELWRRS